MIIHIKGRQMKVISKYARNSCSNECKSKNNTHSNIFSLNNDYDQNNGQEKKM